ncbi:hypothetical protein M422DRAFT_41343 [Sphaerobolus stellatus SS14]|nr:hypothetical protein M422DRAFT_41343 [Sphaerobolus stellatus SS14]
MPPKLISLRFRRSDGDQSKLPTDKLDPTPAEGEVNFMRPVSLTESLSVRWRTQVGKGVAKLLGKPVYSHKDWNNYILEDFPENYQLYQHNKGPPRNPRTDPYLYGSTAGRFRSSPEFIPHAFWLLTDETMNRNNCQCKYCGVSKRTQIEISQDLGLTRAPSVASSIPKAERIAIDSRKPKLRLVPQSRSSPDKLGRPPGGPASPERVQDLRSGRRFRVGELAWCSMSPPILGEHEGERIEFWPVLITKYEIRNVKKPEGSTDWEVAQTRLYTTNFFAIKEYSQTLPESSFLPYQAYTPELSLIDSLRNVGNPDLLQDPEYLSNAKPIPLGSSSLGDQQVAFKDASTAYALALQTAASICRFWSPTEDYQFIGTTLSSSSSAEPSAPLELKETRYEGLWWGSERIWADELIRLIPTRDRVLPKGSIYLLSPSPSAENRGVLMRVNSFISLSTKDGKECKVSGTLYEIIDDTPQASEAVSSSASGPQIQDGPVPRSTPTNPPNLPPYPLPSAPPGCKFHPITLTGYEMVLDVSMIAGRYYPGLWDDPLLHDTLHSPKPDEARVPQLQALYGLTPGAFNSVECVSWANTRKNMIRLANEAAREDLEKSWAPKPLIGVDDDAMDIMEESL